MKEASPPPSSSPRRTTENPSGDAAALVECLANVVSAPDLDRLAHSSLEAVKAAIPSSATSFDLVDPPAGRGRALAATGVSDYFLARYEQVGRRADPVLQRALATQRVTDNLSVVSPGRWATLPIYENVFRLHRLTNVLYAPIVSDGQVVATLDVGRGDALGAFRDDEIALLQSVAQLVGASYASLLERERLERDRRQLLAAVDMCDEAVVISDARSGSRRLNAAARRLFARLPADAPGLDELLPCTGSRTPTLVTETEFGLADNGRAVLRCRSAPLASDPDVVVSLLQFVGGSVGLSAVVEASLTPRERDVVRLAIQGLHDAEIAEALTLSEHTVKQHLKAVYRKLGVRSRVSLARVAL